MKLNCIIDTCTCINLSNTEFKQKKLLDYLNAISILNFSQEVFKELNDHKSKNLPRYIFNKKRNLVTKRYSIRDYEKRMVGRALVSRVKGGNKGEIDNFITAIDQIHHFKKSNVIFITDDNKAINGMIGQDWIPSFPGVNLWSSYDVILYLYAEKIIPSKEIANDLIQDIIKFTSPPLEERSDKTTNERMKIKVRYQKCIDNISKLLN